MTTARLIFAAAVAVAMALPSCSLPDAQPTAVREQPEPTDVLGRPAYASAGHRRELELRERLQGVTRDTREMVKKVRADVLEEVAEFKAPARLATRENYLRNLRRAEAAAYEQAVRDAYDRALARLDALSENAMAEAVAIADAMAPDRSPLDQGPTGDRAIDRQVLAFEDTLRLEIGRGELEAEGYRRALQRVELLAIYTSYDRPEADDSIGGRLIVFVGGDDDSGPRADIVLRVGEGVDPADRGIVQLVRFRVMVGDTIVRDLGWKPLPAPDGLPPIAIDGRYLIAPDVGPDVLAMVGSLEELAERRVVADFQTAVIDRGRNVLGAADWRLEYRVSYRLKPSWQISAVEPRFNPVGAETVAFLSE